MHNCRFSAAPAIAGTVAFLLVGVLEAPVTEASGANSASGGTADTTAGAGAGAPDASAGTPNAAAESAPAPGSGPDSVATVVVTAKRLNQARTEIETQTGASTYTIDSSVIAAAPGGENQSLNQVLLQAPDVVQDSFGQLHVRADHNDLQYRLNGIILPEGISVFSQTLSSRLISSLKLITGALPAEYGLRTAGIIDLQTNSGLLQQGGTVSMYGGSFGTFQPSFEYGGRNGSFSYYATFDYKQSNLGIESPDGSRNPLHDHTTQLHGFGYFENILGENDRLSLILGISDGSYQIPNQRGLQPQPIPSITGLGPAGQLLVNGQYQFLSDDLDENQRELAEYGILVWQHSSGPFDLQTALSVRYTSLHFTPDEVGDLLFNGIAQEAFKDDTAFGWQTDLAYHLGTSHVVRAGFYFQHDKAESMTTSQVLPIDMSNVQPSDVPLVIADNGSQTQDIRSGYLQDEWQVLAPLTINYGVRYDYYRGFSSGSQWSPRINFVWQVGSGTTVHGGYSRYFSPPPFELIGAPTLDKFTGTTALPYGAVTQNDPPIAEKANYYDLGMQQKLLDKTLTLGVDTFYQQAAHLIDEGQFGAPIILTPFNYRYALIGGVEFTGNYTVNNFSAYGNLSFQAAHGKYVESSQFNFSPSDLAYIAENYIHLDHEGRVAASGGISYLWMQTRFSTDFIFGTGLRQALVLPDGTSIPNGDHTPSYTSVNFGVSHDFHLASSGPLTARFDVINAFDKVYQIRSGTGIGVFAPQYGTRRGLFGGLSWQF
jgi:outer membrane receptor protein involved in Fe transport